MKDETQPPDHDLLVRIDERVFTLGAEIKEIKDVHLKELRENILGQITSLAHEKMDRSTVEEWKSIADKAHVDYEKRIRRLEQWGFTAIGALALVEIFLRFLPMLFPLTK